MKIACLIHSLSGGGAERVMAALASRLAGRGHQVELITLDRGLQDRHDVDDAVQKHHLDVLSDSRGIWQKVANTRRRIAVVRRAVLAVRPDVVLSFCDTTNILTLLALSGTGIPVVVSERSDPAAQKLGRFWEWQRRRQYPRASRIIALTETSATYLRDWSNSPIEVIPSAVDQPPLHSNRQRAVGNRTVVGVGRLEHEKGFDRLLEAFAASSATQHGWSLKILGEGSQRNELLELSRQLGIEDYVELPGWIRPVWDQLADATIFALPSRYEGFPSALLEAMAVGVPSLAVDCESGPRAIIRNETDGLLVANQTTALADGLSRMIDQPEWREQLGKSAPSVIKRFGWDSMVDAYERVLQEATTNPTKVNHQPVALSSVLRKLAWPLLIVYMLLLAMFFCPIVDSTIEPYFDLTSGIALAAYGFAQSGGSRGVPIVVGLMLWLLASRPGVTARRRIQECILMTIAIAVFAGGGAALNEHVIKNKWKVPRPNLVFLAGQDGSGPLGMTSQQFYEQGNKAARREPLRKVLSGEPYPVALSYAVREHWIEETGYSFPSGHSFSAMFMCTLFLAMGLTYAAKPRLWYFYLIAPWALAVCYSRPILRVHSPTDVAVGGMQGIVLGGVAYLVVRACLQAGKQPAVAAQRDA